VTGHQLLELLAGVLSGLKWSSQHPDEGGCDEDSKAAFGSVWAGAIVVARSNGDHRALPAAGEFG
jgi:hypothetical protein